jgi:hypothetical protein
MSPNDACNKGIARLLDTQTPEARKTMTVGVIAASKAGDVGAGRRCALIIRRLCSCSQHANDHVMTANTSPQEPLSAPPINTSTRWPTQTLTHSASLCGETASGGIWASQGP